MDSSRPSPTGRKADFLNCLVLFLFKVNTKGSIMNKARDKKEIPLKIKKPLKTCPIHGKLKIENIYYGFYKADIGNFCLKRICGTIGCVNPTHLKSRFEQPNITRTIRTGFTRKPTKIADLTDSEWLKQP